MEHLETEVKFYIPDHTRIRASLVELGAESRGRFFETNIRYEDADNRFIRSGSLLRLRQDRKTTLTLKQKPPGANAEFKVLRELEVDVSDFHTMQAILEAMEFRPVQIYEKWREALFLEDLVFCLDTMPYGSFLEIEGGGPDIRDAAEQLHLPWNRRILANYLSIFGRIQTACSLPFSDVTFRNFADMDEPVEAIIRSFEVGEQSGQGPGQTNRPLVRG